ncbi:MAG TPA: hypothetical protein VJ917_04515, partial [Saprospiraceae bacterium]|nr:hypothetical protein [Saprospiraceae bacterium]
LSVSSRILVSPNSHELWMSHPYMGVFRILWNDDFSDQQLFPSEDIRGIPEISNCYAFKFDDQVVVTSTGQLYAFSHDRDSFVLDENLNALFEKESLVRLITDGDRHFYITDHNTGILQKEQLGTSTEYRKKQLFPTQNLFIGGFENLVFLEERFFICSDQGVIIRRPEIRGLAADLKVQKIQHGDSLLYSSLLTKPISQLELHHDMRELNLNLAVLGKKMLSGDIKLRSVLRKKDSDWSQELEGTAIHLQNLSPGRYVLDGRVTYENKELKYPALLEIHLPFPWYWSRVARALYVLLLLLLLALLGYWPVVRERNDKKKLLIENKKMDSQMQELQAEKDRLELRAMEKALANSTMHLLQKSELLNGLRKEIENVSGRVKDPVAKKELRVIENKLKDDKRLQEDWENFTKHFNRIHNNFIRRLKKEYPHLTPNDLKLCAYLRLNLRTKEIAPLLGISVRGVEVSRYRLRKKLNLDSNTNLNDFMISY